MTGRHRNRLGLPKPACEMIVNQTRCKTIPASNWRYCPPHHAVIARQMASQWERDLDRHKTTTIDVRLPDLNKPLKDLDIHEQAALAQLILWQHDDLELPTAPKHEEPAY